MSRFPNPAPTNPQNQPQPRSRINFAPATRELVSAVNGIQLIAERFYEQGQIARLTGVPFTSCPTMGTHLPDADQIPGLRELRLDLCNAWSSGWSDTDAILQRFLTTFEPTNTDDPNDAPQTPDQTQPQNPQAPQQPNDQLPPGRPQP